MAIASAALTRHAPHGRSFTYNTSGGGPRLLPELPLRECVGELYQRESRRVFSTLVRLLGDFDLAEETLQEAFAAGLEKWPQRPAGQLRDYHLAQQEPEWRFLSKRLQELK